MDLSIIPDGSIPAYKQLYDKVSSQILSGRIMGGSSLPPIRTVARELGVSIITVRNAWDKLIEDGFIESRAGSGCFAASLTEEERLAKRRALMTEPIKEMIEKAASLGFSKAELIKMIGKE